MSTDTILTSIISAALFAFMLWNASEIGNERKICEEHFSAEACTHMLVR